MLKMMQNIFGESWMLFSGFFRASGHVVIQPPAKKQVVCRKIPQKAFKGKNYAKDKKIPLNT